LSTLHKQAARDFNEEAWQGRVHYQRSVDVRYRGQGYELTLPFTRNLLREFEEEHKRRYGYTHPTRDVELVTLRLRAVVKSPPLQSTTARVRTGAFVSLPLARPRVPGRARLGSPSMLRVPVLFDGKKLATAIHSRDALKPGKTYHGPAIITEYSATTLIPPGKRFHIDPAANLIVTI
jgi:N-methylhydantoinase A